LVGLGGLQKVEGQDSTSREHECEKIDQYLQVVFILHRYVAGEGEQALQETVDHDHRNDEIGEHVVVLEVAALITILRNVEIVSYGLPEGHDDHH
jgi:hypothetical protein